MTEDILKNRFLAYLQRLSAPRAIAENIEAKKAEVEGLLAILRKYAAPEPQQWWEKVELVLMEECKSRSWPTGNELREACTKVNAKLGTVQTSRKAGVGSGYRPDKAKITAKRIKKGEPVGERDLTGVLAREMIERELVTQAELDSYGISG
ncbi:MULTISPECIES: hypothetical protein [Halocynthiibacter]|uniref:Uncharacterized protein n=1 Tax=Halocynthiibacter halioticoli TaxID=2986804 RepID=A0AAE3LTY7_9RHOB|nr:MULTISPECIES: hypothetical protein [Halocynthiibacter]MCV6826016.1 hypothetical protein [Halocynthiibacter halioticoli]MCW4059017.1 hypothetical protein [Halocynthiibacter sp. SDUM655004]